MKKAFIGFIFLVSLALALTFATSIRSSKKVNAGKAPQRSKLEEKIKRESANLHELKKE